MVKRKRKRPTPAPAFRITPASAAFIRKAAKPLSKFADKEIAIVKRITTRTGKFPRVRIARIRKELKRREERILKRASKL